MRYYLDTEFDDDVSTGRINLISIGLVCEDGREFYAVSNEFNPETCNDWVKANVLPQLTSHGDIWLSRSTIRDAIQNFISDDRDTVEIWAYYASYDWVVFCQLWKEMTNLPKHFPKFVRDLKTYALDIGYGGRFKDLLPDTDHRHHALADARWNRDIHKILLHLSPKIVKPPTMQLAIDLAYSRDALQAERAKLTTKIDEQIKAIETEIMNLVENNINSSSG